MDEDFLLLLVHNLVHNLSDPEEVEAVILFQDVAEWHPDGPNSSLCAEASKVSPLDPKPLSLIFSKKAEDLLDASSAKVINVLLAGRVRANVHAHIVNLLVNEPTAQEVTVVKAYHTIDDPFSTIVPADPSVSLALHELELPKTASLLGISSFGCVDLRVVVLYRLWKLSELPLVCLDLDGTSVRLNIAAIFGRKPRTSILTSYLFHLQRPVVAPKLLEGPADSQVRRPCLFRRQVKGELDIERLPDIKYLN